jgi:glycosyltransferase involved in cell wall biosynthesis
MARLAWFSPLPPTRSGIAQYSCELLPALALSHHIDTFVDGPVDGPRISDDRIRVYDAHDFIWKHHLDAYDLFVYQLGNAPCHDYIWPYLFRYPGLVVLHDGQLHHARARLLLQQKRHDDYRREFSFNHPHADVDVPELGAEGLLGSMTYFWPMLRTVIESSRLIVVHNTWLADRLREEHPDARVHVVEMGVRGSQAQPDGRERIRASHRIPDDAVVFMSLGKITPEKRIREAVLALAALHESFPSVHLVLAGETVDHYDALADARKLHVERNVSSAGFIDDTEIDDYLAAADVCLCMRWPTSRETSASWLRSLAAGRPTITTDLIHMTDIPTLDPRDGALLGGSEPVGFSVDIVDEKHSLGLAMRRLAEDPRLRVDLGKNARKLWDRRFRLAEMVAAYREVIDLALTAPPSRPGTGSSLPSHLLTHGTEYASRLLADAGLPASSADGIWTPKAD